MSVSGRGTRISLRVYPNAARNEVVGFADGVLRLKVAAAPVRGEANRELIAFLAKLLGVDKSALTIIKGHTSRNKLLAVSGLDPEEVFKRLKPA